MHYYDYCSLYPWVNLTAAYPVLHPEIIIGNFGDISTYNGMALVDIEPPRKLFHPVLPYRSGKKLKFPLCRTCADTEYQGSCKHSSDKRAIVGVYCTPELKKAVELGYKIRRIYEVYHWPYSAQDKPECEQEGIFSSYVKTFLKLKQESSGYPSHCKTEEECQAYVEWYLEKQGIKLDKNNIRYNASLRTIAKLMLNRCVFKKSNQI